MFGEIVDDCDNVDVQRVGGQNVGVQNFEPRQSGPTKRMVLNAAGIVAHDCWMNIPHHFPNAVLHAFVVMPNHVHGIIELKDNPDSKKRNEFQKMIPRSIGSIVRGFKIGVTKWFRQQSYDDPVWERNYFEHIIRDGDAFQTITYYINNNPQNWNDDKYRYE